MTETAQPVTYDVVLLIEKPLTEADAKQVRGLHEELEDPVRYHLLLPVDDAATRVESAMGAIAATEVMATPAMVLNPEELEQIQQELLDQSRADLAASVKAMENAGADVTGEIVSIDPVEALGAKVAQVGAAEAIILTRPHVVSEFFHVDWTSRARRHIGVPILHLLEHENFDEQAGGGGEGITGM